MKDASDKLLASEDVAGVSYEAPTSYRSDGGSSKATGWRKAVRGATYAASIVLVINVLFTIVAIAKDGTKNGIGTLYTGKCSTISALDSVFHMFINVLSTILLGCSNYAMQCLGSPTRSEVDKAHARGRWMHIGISSFKNVRRIGGRRMALWILLGVSTLPLHLLWNSAVFTTLQANEFRVLIVAPDFLTSSFNCNLGNLKYNSAIPPNTTEFCTIAEEMYSSKHLERLTNADCMRAYSSNFIAGRQNLLAVVRDARTSAPGQNPDEGSIFYYLDSTIWENNLMNDGGWMPQRWLCSSPNWTSIYEPFNYDTNTQPCDLSTATAHADDWQLGQPNLEIDHCLSEIAPELCELQFIMYIMFVVIACNLAKLVCIALTIRTSRELPLAVIGDALASFIGRPDESTLNMCLVTARDMDNGLNTRFHPKPWKAERLRWSSTSTRGSWVRLFVFYSLMILLTSLLLHLGIQSISSNGKNVSFSSLSFGAVSPYALITLLGEGALNLQLNSASVLVPIILLANAPQLIFSCLYFLYNRIYTRALAMEEWTQYAYKRQGLRVSYPVGLQRSTYWLHLPYRYSVPLLVVSSLMHWLVSQAIFLARVKIYSIDGTYDETQPPPEYGLGGGATPAANSGSTTNGILTLPGYSPKAIIAVLIVGTAMFIVLILSGLKKYRPGIPLVGNNSLAISAMCHGPVVGGNENDEAALPLMWGAVNTEAVGSQLSERHVPGIGHCCLSSLEVEAPVPGELYA